MIRGFNNDKKNVDKNDSNVIIKKYGGFWQEMRSGWYLSGIWVLDPSISAKKFFRPEIICNKSSHVNVFFNFSVHPRFSFDGNGGKILISHLNYYIYSNYTARLIENKRSAAKLYMFNICFINLDWNICIFTIALC